MAEVPTIETARLRLRPWRAGDAEAYAEMRADPRVGEFLGGPKPREESIAMVARLTALLDERGYGWWVAEVTATGAFAGTIILQEIPFEAHFTPALEVGWHLVYDHWKHGYASEGGRALIDHAFGALGRDRVVAITAATNVRSQRVMERIGMVRDPNGDFEHPNVPPGSPLRLHVLYTIRR
jgi:ribosomal-protein-alanine N-acetyltransferase